MSLAEQKWLRLGTLVVLYVAQGIPWGFMATTIPGYLAERGLDAGAVGLALATTTLPYTFKWVWGPIIDAFGIPRWGRRRPWIILAQLMMAVTVAAMLAIPDLTTDLKLLAWMILIHTVFNALQDVSVDALAVDLLDEDERGRANGFMYAAKYGGGIVGGAGMSSVIAATSFETALVVQAAILLGIMLVPLLVRETARPVERRPSVREVVRALSEVYAMRSPAVMALVMLTFTFAHGVLTARASVLYVGELKWTAAKYTDLVGGYGLAMGFLGAVLGGVLADLLGHRLLAALGAIGMGAGWLVFGSSPGLWHEDWFVYGTSMWETFCQAMMSVSLFALCMDVALPAAGASQFAAYMALSNFSTTLGYRAVGQLPASWTVADVYIAACIVQIAVTLLLVAVDPHEVRRARPAAPPAATIPARGYAVAGALALFLASMTAYIVSGLI